jgi:hypothetical protein
MHALVSGKARMAAPARSLLARAGGVWMWPGVPLTERRGAAHVPVAPEVARFWISRLYGPAANDSAVLRCLDVATQKLNENDEAGAQKALDTSGLSRLSPDGVVLARAVAGSLGIAPLDLQWADGPRLWRAEDIAAHLPLFKDYAAGAGLAGAWDESKHPRVPGGSPEGGRFQSGGGGADTGNGGPIVEGRSAAKKPSEHGSPPLGGPPEIPKDEPPTKQLRNVFAKLAARWLARAMAGSAFGPTAEFVTALDAAAETASWLYDKYPYIKAYLDGPKSHEELQGNVGKPEKGYEVHHIVEQTAASREGHSQEDIDGPDNLVRTTLKHWEITGGI